ncbi:MAG: hypothetical protein AB1846_12880 [Chloroflexota bacterium]
MTNIDNEMLWRQFGAAIDMLDEALRGCPDALWEKRLWEDRPGQWVAAGFSAFWYLGYHALFWLDLYLVKRGRGFCPTRAVRPGRDGGRRGLAADLYA